jgi:hypothetical protein
VEKGLVLLKHGKFDGTKNGVLLSLIVDLTHLSEIERNLL